MNCSLILSTGICTDPLYHLQQALYWWLQCIPQTGGCHGLTAAHKTECKMFKDCPTWVNITFCTGCKPIGIETCYYAFALGSFFCFAYSLLTAWPYVPSFLLSLPSRETNQLEMHPQSYIFQGQFFKPWESQTYHHRSCHSRKCSYFFNLPPVCSKNKEQMTTLETCLSILVA